MPVYTIRDKHSGEEWDTVMSFGALQDYLEQNPNLVQALSTPKIVAQTGGTLARTSDGWKDHLNNMHKHAGRESKIKT